jgi:transposase
MLPVMIRASAVGEMTAQLPMPRSPGLIEIDIGAARVRVRGAVDEANLRCVLQALGAQR